MGLKGGKEGGEEIGKEMNNTLRLGLCTFFAMNFRFSHSLFITLLRLPLGAPSWKCGVRPNLQQ